MGFGSCDNEFLRLILKNAPYIKMVVVDMCIHAKELLEKDFYCLHVIRRKRSIFAFIKGRTLEEVRNVLEKRVYILICSHL